MKKKPRKEIKKKDIAQLGVILGQLSYLQPANFNGARVYIVDGKVKESWEESLKEILETEIYP